MFQKSKRNFNSGLQTIIIHSDTTFQKTGDMNYSFSEDINVMFLKKKKGAQPSILLPNIRLDYVTKRSKLQLDVCV